MIQAFKHSGQNRACPSSFVSKLRRRGNLRVALKRFLILILLAPSLHAMAAKDFQFTARATGLDDSTPLEFILITSNSGHDYESIAISDLSAREILNGIKDLGAVAGHPINPQTLQFWPKGEWLDIEVSFKKRNKTVTVPAGELVLQRPGKGTLKKESWTLCGSVEMTDEQGNSTLAVDAREPGSILSVYNESESLMDRSGQADKLTIYGSLFAAPKFQLAEGQELTFSIRRKKQSDMFQPLDLEILAEADGAGLVYSLTGSGDAPLATRTSFQKLQSLIKKTQRSRPNLYLSTRPDSALTLAQVQEMYGQIMSMESDGRARLNPPASPHFFFKSFFPDPAFHTPQQRPSQPWELHVGESNALHLIRYEVTERDLQGQPTLEETRIDDVGAQSLASHLQLGSYDVPVLLVYAPSTLAYGELLQVLAPIRGSYDTFYFFLGEK